MLPDVVRGKPPNLCLLRHSRRSLQPAASVRKRLSVDVRSRAREIARVSFAVPAELYDRFMGRYSVLLAPPFADFARLTPGRRVLDVGCGPGALTTELVARLGAGAVVAV